MISWKGYTIIAVTGLSGSPTFNEWSFRGTGKISMLGKNVGIFELYYESIFFLHKCDKDGTVSLYEIASS